MERPAPGVLEELYGGRFRGAVSSAGPCPVDEARLEGFLARYREAVASFDPREVERSRETAAALLERMKATGIFGLLIPREHGGLGFTLSEYLRVIEEVAASDMALAIIPLAHLSIGVKGVLLFGSEDQKRRYLPRAASGEMIFAYALTEPGTGSDAQHIETVADEAPDGSFRLSGTKTYITNANYAGAFTVFAQLDHQRSGRMGAFVVERSWEGVRVGQDMPKMGLAASSTAAVHLRDVRVPRENMIGGPGDGFRIAMTILNYGRLGLAAASTGLLARSLADMRKRAESRRQFGSALKEFPLVQEKLVAARAHGLAASAMTYFTASLLEKDPLRNVALESSHCKLYGTTRCWETLNDALQTAGGAGYLSTLPYEKRVRDFRVTTIFEGTTEIHSLYPALAVARSWGREIEARGPVARLLTLARLGLRRGLVVADPSPPLAAALSAAAWSERLARRLISYGLRRYGSGIAKRELLLRRATHLSLSLFWIAASVERIRASHPDRAYPQEELDALAYLVEEAREVQERDGHRRESRRERIGERIMAAL